MAKPIQRLSPARPDAHELPGEAGGYLPRIPWRFVLLGALSVATVVGGFYWKEQRKALELREQIIRVHETELGQAREAYMAQREKLEGLILGAARGPTENLIDRRLHIPGLRSGNGLYLRLPLAQASSKQAIARAAKVMDGDLIASCLGLAPTSARGLYEHGEFLLPAYIESVKKQTSVMKLRVQDDMLSRHIRADLPSVLGLLRSDWFMLVLQEGENRRDSPVRVFLWDLQHGDLLLRARVRSQGVLLTSHILSQGSNPRVAPPNGERTTGAANDCSIAAQLKQLSSASAQHAGE
jgi:hypothetical protein